MRDPKDLNRRFLLLQSLAVMVNCVGAAFLSPILLRFGYEPLAIGSTLGGAALAGAAAKPFWGYLNDRFACARQITIGLSIAGVCFYALLVAAAGNPALITAAVLLLYMTLVCQTNFIDSWAVRLIHAGYRLNYGATRAGGSLSYAVIAAVYGTVMAEFGPAPGIGALAVLAAGIAAVSLTLPNPAPAPRTGGHAFGPAARSLLRNRPFLCALAAYFLCSVASSGADNNLSVLLTDMGGTEQQVGIALFCQAVSEVPIMVGYALVKRRTGWPARIFLSCGIFFFGLKVLGLGLANSFGAVFAVVLLHGMAFGLLTAAVVDFMLETVAPGVLATAHLLFSAIGSSLAVLFGGVICGALAQYMGVSFMLRLISLCAFAGAALVFFTARPARQTESAQ